MQGGSDGFVIDPSGKSFMGRLGPDLKLAGKVCLLFFFAQFFFFFL